MAKLLLKKGNQPIKVHFKSDWDFISKEKTSGMSPCCRMNNSNDSSSAVSAIVRINLSSFPFNYYRYTLHKNSC